MIRVSEEIRRGGREGRRKGERARTDNVVDGARGQDCLIRRAQALQLGWHLSEGKNR